MKPSKPMFWLGLVLASGWVLVSVVALQRYLAPKGVSAPAPAAAVPTGDSAQGAAAPSISAPVSGPAVNEGPVAPPETPAAPAAKADVASTPKAPPVAQAKPASGKKPAIQDLLAREALSLVGVDPKAEGYWMEAINDARLSAQERQDLIEDLNEDGLSDPKHPGPEDLPVILNRLALIEQLAPNAMDDVNFDAFREAYKDLLNLADVVVGGGEPVN